MRVDTREFNEALRQLSRTTTKDMKFFLDDQARRLAWDCLKATPKVSPGEIEKALNVETIQTGTRTIKRGKRAGQTVATTTKRVSSPLIYQIVNAKRKARGEDPVWGAEMSKEARAEINSRKRGIGYMKSGWLPAIKAFSIATGRPFGRGGVKEYGRPKGKGIPAGRNLINMVAQVINTAVQPKTRNSTKPGKAMRIAERVMQSAMAARVIDIRATLAKRMERILARHSARRT